MVIPGENVDFNDSARRIAAAIETQTGIGCANLFAALAEGETTITASFTFTAVQTGEAVTVTRTSVLTVKQPVGLVLSAQAQTLQIGQSTTVTVTSIDPAPEGG